VLSGVLAFTVWGAMPIYFVILDNVPAIEIVMHRIVWALPFAALIISLRRQWPEVRRVLADRRALGLLLMSAAVIFLNWLIFTWAAQNERIFEASLGYYINPLMMVLVGYAFFRERLRPVQTGAVVLATIGVSILTFSAGEFPIIAISLASFFTLYGVNRKRLVVGALPGLFVELLIIFPLSAAYLYFLIRGGTSPFTLSDPKLFGLLLLAGPLTVLPLVFFAVAARRLRLATIGFIQFIGPTGQFLVGYYYGEALTMPYLICFIFIWVAVSLFVFDAVRNGRQLRAMTRLEQT
jgi:chloramphenicol-sensitive protein RarD